MAAQRDDRRGNDLKVFLAGASLAAAYGGPAYSVSRLAEALADKGLSVGLWAADGTVAEAPIEETRGVVRLTGSARDAIDTLGGADVIHDSGLWLRHNHALAREARERGIPRVVSVRGMLEPWAFRHKWLKKRIAWTIYQKRDLLGAALLHATTVVEEGNLSRLVPDVPVAVIPNGVDVPPLEDIRPRAGSAVRNALFLGRLYPVKGLPMLVEAWSQVHPRSWKLTIAGPDEAGHRKQLEQQISASGLSGVISFAGQVSGREKTSLLAAADLFILPTHSESFGMAIAEALAHGVPVLTTLAAPWPEIEQVGCGWRSEPTPERLADALRVATSATTRDLEEMGMRGRALVSSRYRWDAVATAMLEAYERCGAVRPRGSRRTIE